ncbi:DUF308 domain-containing protein [Butyrivibrio sp. AE3004]|uniref:DUF308 domain-containing protein n=1 Tax=Butyrivibrio sp. AE3004 TaxID=1506994 RepID=UPI000493C3D5|nr:DUF308 domain-containing protein [Butyrivibrio sp. AE3004]
MSKFQRIRNIIFSIIMIVYAIMMIMDSKEAYPVVLAIMALALMISGVSELLYYFFMAQFMVGGKMVLYKGIISIDFGLLTGAITDIPTFYIIMYLATIHAFSGLVELLRANEARTYGTSSWKLKFMHGIINILIALFCFIFIKEQDTAVIIYSVGIIYSGILRLISAFRKTTMVYIQ